MKRLIAPLAALLCCAACGIPATSVRFFGGPASPSTGTAAPSASSGAYSYTLWFWNSAGNSPRLVREVRYTDTKPTAEIVYEQLVSGPNPDDANSGIYTALTGFPGKLLPRLQADLSDTIRIGVPWGKVNDQARAQLYCSLSAQALRLHATAGNQDVLGIYTLDDTDPPNWHNCNEWAVNGAPPAGVGVGAASPSP